MDVTFDPIRRPAGFGAAPRRLEDEPLLTGRGSYPSDATAEGMLHAVVLRSAAGHARVRLGGLDAVRAMPGVRAVLTGTDVAHLGHLPTVHLVRNADGSPFWAPPYPVLNDGIARHVGDALAFVVAESVDAARDAAEAVVVDYEALPAVVDVEAALAPDAPLVWPERGTNVVYDTTIGDRAATDAAFARAHRTVEITVRNNRVVANYMEPRSVLASYEATADRYTAILGSQGVHGIRRALCDAIFGIPHDRMRVITPPDVGGGFGTKYFLYREYPLALHAARLVGHPVRWAADRLDHFLSDYHGRDHVSRARLALDADGRILALDADVLANMGAYLSQLATFVPFNGAHLATGCYDIPVACVRVRGVFTHTVPVDAYRGAGRPEAAYLIERLADKAAREAGLPPDVFRRRNFVPPSAMPYRTPLGRTYDSGAFDDQMTAAMALADWDGFPARAAASAAAGRLRGIGLATYVEACAGFSGETATLRLEADGRVTILIGSQASGQGHRTSYAQLAAEHLGLPVEAFDLVQGDTDRVATGSGTGGSRSVTVGGVVVVEGARDLARRIRDEAAERLEAAAVDIELADGRARVAGTDRSMPYADLAAGAAARGDLLSGRGQWTPPEFTYPNGTHVVEVEIDPDTGVVGLDRYAIVDDFGVVVNPLLLEGQIHGGIAQGFGQAVTESTVYEAGTGQLLTASFMDYGMPRAGDLPFFRLETRNVPCTTNLMGMKGAGEAGTIGACPAIMNAIVDALHRANGTLHIDMPATPERVWRVLNGG